MAIPHPDAPPTPRAPRPTTPPPKPVNYGRTGPGTHLESVGAKMRQETAQALEQLMKHGSFATGLEETVKLAIAMRMPTPTPGMASRAATAVGGAARATGKAMRPLAYGAGIGLAGAGLGLGALAHHTAQADEQARRPSLVYSPMTGVA